MNRNVAMSLVVLLVVIVAVVLLAGKRGDSTVMTPTPSSVTSESLSVSPSATPTGSAGDSLLPSISVGVAPESVTVTYSNEGYSPSSVNIKKGSIVVWQNKSTKDMWPASAKHPSHKDYPEQSTCFAGSFDSCNIKPGASYAFTFNQAGTWKYHDHLTPANTGTVVVTQ